MPVLNFRLESAEGAADAEVSVGNLVIAGWTARDVQAVQHHIEELARLGVKPPSQVPLFYRVAAALLTQRSVIEVLGEASSGEAEPVLFGYRGELWLTVGSDHTDRNVEAFSVAVSKQMCAKPIAASAWRFRDVEPHWDSLLLRSFIMENGKRTLYQQGTLATMRSPADLLPRYGGRISLEEGLAMSCGTLGAIGGVRLAADFTMEIEDPILHRLIRHRYRVTPLPMVS